jgi:glutathione synthase/RimK-type ligase-like ATP-grasp enzyme
MKLCIIGPEDRTNSDLALLKAGKRLFNSVLYIPYTGISLHVGNKTGARYKNIDLSGFDAVLPRIPKHRYLFGYLLLKTLDVSSPIRSYSYVTCSDRFLMMDALKQKELEVPEIHYMDSVRSFSPDNMQFPIAMRVPEQEQVMIANTVKESKSMVDALKTFKKPVYIEEFVKGKYLEYFVVDEKIVAGVRRKPKNESDIYHGKGNIKKVRIKKRHEELAIRAADAVKTDLAVVRIAKDKVIDVVLCPRLTDLIRKDINIDYEIINYIKNISEAYRPIVEQLVSKMKRVRDIFD